MISESELADLISCTGHGALSGNPFTLAPPTITGSAVSLSLVFQKDVQQAVGNFLIRIGLYRLTAGQAHNIGESVLGRGNRDIKAQLRFALLVVGLDHVVYLISRYRHP